jgi:hypothetical protein
MIAIPAKALDVTTVLKTALIGIGDLDPEYSGRLNIPLFTEQI